MAKLFRGVAGCAAAYSLGGSWVIAVLSESVQAQATAFIAIALAAIVFVSLAALDEAREASNG